MLTQVVDEGVIDDEVSPDDRRRGSPVGKQVAAAGQHPGGDEDRVRLAPDYPLDGAEGILGPRRHPQGDAVVDRGDEGTAAGTVEEPAEAETGTTHMGPFGDIEYLVEGGPAPR